ncbi:MAG: hypothetical protein ACRDSH_01485 [Pseudonocardiaceae bacterium]
MTIELDESCPGCRRIEGVELSSATARATTWRCTGCGLNWALSVVNPHLREISAARVLLRRVVALADQTGACT